LFSFLLGVFAFSPWSAIFDLTEAAERILGNHLRAQCAYDDFYKHRIIEKFNAGMWPGIKSIGSAN